MEATKTVSITIASVHSPGSGSNPAEAQILDLDEPIHSVFRALASESGFFHPAEGRHFRRNQSTIDADNSVFQRFRDPPHPSYVAAIEVSGQAEFRIICERNCIGFRLEAKEWRNRTKRLFPSDSHL